MLLPATMFLRRIRKIAKTIEDTAKAEKLAATYKEALSRISTLELKLSGYEHAEEAKQAEAKSKGKTETKTKGPIVSRFTWHPWK